MSTIKELKEHLESYKDEDIIAFALWTPADAIWQAKRENYHLTQVQAEMVIDRVHLKHDAEVGINWDTLSFHLPSDLPEIPKDCPYPDDSECGDCQKCKPKV